VFPLLQIQQECDISLFHPEVYPLYRLPEESSEGEYTSQQCSTVDQRQSWREMNAHKSLRGTISSFQKIRETLDEKPPDIQKSFSFKDSQRSSIRSLIQSEKESLYEKEKSLYEMRQSHRQMQQLVERKSIKINDIDVNLDDIDLNQVTQDKAKDIKDIEDLHKQIEIIALDMTLSELNQSAASEVSSGKAAILKQLQKSLELVKMKLEFKQQLIDYKTESQERFEALSAVPR